MFLLYLIINKLPNQYHILTENCQNFVNNVVDALKVQYNIIFETNSKKIEESLNDIQKINMKNKKRNKDNKESNKNFIFQNYVDENSIYLCNIFEEKKKKLMNSRSDGNIRVFGRLNKKLNRKGSAKSKSIKNSEDVFNLKY